MKKIIIFLVTLLIFILFVISINVVNDKDDSLSQPEIVTVLEEKEYLFSRLIISYDEYRKIYIKYYENENKIDDRQYYNNIIDSETKSVLLKEFIGKDIDEIRDYLITKGYSLEVYDDFLEKHDSIMHKVKISDVYYDNYNDWSYVFVEKEIESDLMLYYVTEKYTFKKVGNQYKIIMRNSGSNCLFTKKDLRMLSQEEKDERILNQPFKYVNNELVKYTKVIDMKNTYNDNSINNKMK